LSSDADEFSISEVSNSSNSINEVVDEDEISKNFSYQLYESEVTKSPESNNFENIFSSPKNNFSFSLFSSPLAQTNSPFFKFKSPSILKRKRTPEITNSSKKSKIFSPFTENFLLNDSPKKSSKKLLFDEKENENGIKTEKKENKLPLEQKQINVNEGTKPKSYVIKEYGGLKPLNKFVMTNRDKNNIYNQAEELIKKEGVEFFDPIN
jgi:hypothetical protein